MIRRLTFSILAGNRLSEAEIEALWQIRTSYLTLTKTAAEDLAYFRDFITIENGLVIPFRDTAGTLQGFFTSVALPMEFEGRRGLVSCGCCGAASPKESRLGDSVGIAALFTVSCTDVTDASPREMLTRMDGMLAASTARFSA